MCGYNLVVECHASDLIARVRFSLPAPLSKIVAPDESIDKSDGYMRGRLLFLPGEVWYFGVNSKF